MKFQRGFLLLSVSVALLVLSVLAFSLMKSAGLAARTGSRAIDLERARLLGEAGMAHALRNMQIPDNNVCKINEKFSASTDCTEKTAYLSGNLEGLGDYRVCLIKPLNDTNGEPPPLRLEATGTLVNGTKNTISLALPTVTFALPGWLAGADGRAVAATAIADEDMYRGNFKLFDAKVSGSTSELPVFASIGNWLTIQTLLRFGFDQDEANQSAFPGLTDKSRILNARLGLYQTSDSSGSAMTLSVHEIEAKWRAATVQWPSPPAADGKQLGTMKFRTGTGMRWVALDVKEKGDWLTKGLLLKATTDGYNGVTFRSKEYSTDQMFAPRLELVYIKGCE